MDTIEITGSRIRRVDTETASPVFTIDRATIQNSGVATVGELIQELPSMSGAATNPRVNNGGGTGQSVASLRGLGEQRTLVLMNGRRLAPEIAGTVEGVDINSIPVNFIERVEVLKEGASAIYGSDAIGGVINFITRKDFSGGEAILDYGTSSESDGERQGVQLSWGTGNSKANMLLGVHWHQQDEISAGDREFARNALYLYGGVVTPGGSSRTPTGRLFLPDTDPDTAGTQDAFGFGCGSVTRIAGAAGDSLDDYRCFNIPADLYNFQPVNLVLTPQERAGLFTTANYKITDDLEAYTEAFFGNTQSGFQIASLPLDTRLDNVVISPDNVYNPFTDQGFGGGDAVFPNASYRLEALGGRRSETETSKGQINLGLRGGIGETTWRWDAAFTYGRTDQSANTFGYLFQPALLAPLGPSFDANPAPGIQDPRCGTPGNEIPGCTPINIFNLPLALQDPAQAAAFAAASAGYGIESTRDQESYLLNFSGDLFRMPAGAAQLAVGFERREQRLTTDVDFLAQGVPPDFLNCQLAQETCTNATNGDLDVDELYAEAFVPLLADAPGAEAFNVILGTRWSDYSRFGSTTNSKIGLEYRPFGDLLARLSYAEVFRAPTISDLFLAITANAPTFNDPCVGLDDADIQANPNLALACEGVEPNGEFAQANSQVTGRFRGNIDLAPEEGEVLTFGAVYDPSWLPNASFVVDFWNYALENVLEPVDVNTSAAVCAAAGNAATFNAQGDSFCSLINRFPEGDVNFIDQPIVNLGEIDLTGVDFGVKYALDNTPAGKFRFGLDVTHFASFERTLYAGAPTVDAAGTFSRQDGNFAEWRWLGYVDWTLANFNATITPRYIGEVECCIDPATGIVDADGGPGDPIPLAVDAVTYVDLAFGYEVPRLRTKLRVGIDNVTDEEPPFLYQNNVINANTDVETYDTIGTFYWLRLVQPF